jgi:hypothetical protein
VASVLAVVVADTMVPIDPGTLAGRLERLGFTGASVDAEPKAFRFREFVPA